MTSEFVLTSCCRTAPERSTFLEFRENLPEGAAILRDAVESDLKPDPWVAFHEAGHLVIGLLYGLEPVTAFAGSGGFVEWKPNASVPEAELIMTLAGDFAGGLAHRHQYRPHDAELLPWLELIRTPAGGYCDRCRIVRLLVSKHGLDATDATILAAYREAEEKTLEILRRLDVRAAIRAVAEILISDGRLDGATAIEIARRHIVPGELAKGD
jgi:hypothetical protein